MAVLDVIHCVLQSPIRVGAVLILLGLLLANFVRRFHAKYPCPLPPSPPAEPFLGHFRSLPLENAHLQHMQYAKKYSKSVG